MNAAEISMDNTVIILCVYFVARYCAWQVILIEHSYLVSPAIILTNIIGSTFK